MKVKVKVWSEEYYDEVHRKINNQKDLKDIPIPEYGKEYFGIFEIKDTEDLRRQLKKIGATGKVVAEVYSGKVRLEL